MEFLHSFSEFGSLKFDEQCSTVQCFNPISCKHYIFPALLVACTNSVVETRYLKEIDKEKIIGFSTD